MDSTPGFPKISRSWLSVALLGAFLLLAIVACGSNNSSSGDDDQSPPADDDVSPAADDDDNDDNDTPPDDDDTMPSDDDDDNDDNDNDNDASPADDDDDNDASPADWTFVVYMAADNNLGQYGYGTMNMQQMETVGSTPQMNILVIYSGQVPGDSHYYKVNHNSLDDLVDPGWLNMADPVTLENSVKWAFDNFPAKKYALVLWDHGEGWEKKKTKDCCEDDGPGGGALMTNDQLITALTWIQANTAVKNIDLFGFDCCMMAMAEIDYYLRPFAAMNVGSEETEGDEGWAYDKFLGQLKASPTMTAAQLGTLIAQTYVEYPDATQSAADLTKLDALATAVDAFAVTLIAVGGNANASVLDALENTLAFFVTDYIDLYDFTVKIQAENLGQAVNDAATAVQTAVANAVIYHAHGLSQDADEHGISIYFPNPVTDPPPYYLTSYADLSWAKNVPHWTDLISGVN